MKLKLLFLLLFFGIFVNNIQLVSQEEYTKFAVTIDGNDDFISYSPYLDQFGGSTDHKLWLQIVNGDLNLNREFHIEIITHDLIMENYQLLGYNLSTEIGIGLGTCTYLIHTYSKTVTIESGDVFSDIFYYLLNGNGCLSLYNIWFRVYDEYFYPASELEHIEDFTERNIVYYRAHLKPFEFPCNSDNTNLLYRGTHETGPGFIIPSNKNLYHFFDCIPPLKDPFDLDNLVDWYVSGDIFLQMDGTYASDWSSYDLDPSWTTAYYIKGQVPDQGGQPRDLAATERANRIRMNGSFTIQGNTALIASNIKVESMAGNVGKGFILKDGAYLSLSNCLIQDQETAVTLIGESSLQIRDCYFTDNKIGIKVLPDGEGGISKIYFSAAGAFSTAPFGSFFGGSGNMKSTGPGFPDMHIYVAEGAIAEIEVYESKITLLPSTYGIYNDGGIIKITGAGNIDFSKKVLSPFNLSDIQGSLPFFRDDVADEEKYFKIGQLDGVPFASEFTGGGGIYTEANQSSIPSLEIIYDQWYNDGKDFTIIKTIKGIEVQGGTVNIDHTAILESHEEGILFNNGKLIVKNSLISEAENGIYITNGNVTIRDSEIEKVEETGIKIEHAGQTSSTLNMSGTEIRASNIGIHINNAYSILKDLDITEARKIGVYLGNQRNKLFSISESNIESDVTGFLLAGQFNGINTIGPNNTITAERSGIQKLICTNTNLHLHNNLIKTKQYGLWTRLTIGSGYTRAINNEFHAYSLNSELFLNTAAILKQTSYRLRAQDNDIHMKGAKYGVKLLRTNGDIIESNNIKFKMEPGQGTYGDGIGIKIQGGENNKLTCNTAFQDDVADGTKTIAYLTENSPHSMLMHNNTNRVNTGALFTGQNGNTTVVGNAFNRHEKGVVYGTDTQKAYTGPQEHTGNLWANVQTSVTGFRDATYLNGVANDYNSNAYVINPNHDPIPGGTMNPAHVSPGGMVWFKHSTQKDNYIRTASCEYNTGAIEDIYALDEGNYNIMMGDSIDFGIFDQQIKESYYRYMYRELMKGNIGFSSPGTIAYQLELKGVNTDLVDVHQMIETKLYGSDRSLAEFNQLDEKMEDISDAIGLYTLIPDSLTSVRETAWTSLLGDFDALMALTDTATVSLTQMESALTGLTNRHTYTPSETALHTALLGTVRFIKGDSTAYANMKDDIMDIAVSCPYELGEAVYMARALVGDDYPYSHEDFSMCDYSEPLLKKDIPQVTQSTVYPIPSSGRITVEYPDGAERIMIYGLDGKLVYDSVLDGKEGILDISLTQAGVFQLQVLKTNDEIEVRKIVIVK